MEVHLSFKFRIAGSASLNQLTLTVPYMEPACLMLEFKCQTPTTTNTCQPESTNQFKSEVKGWLELSQTVAEAAAIIFIAAMS